MFGMSARANSTSTTAPMHWTMVPWLMFVSSGSFSVD
jgi:hypothetical protein